MRYRTWILAGALALGASRSASAQTAEVLPLAAEQFRDGRAALARNDYTLALGLFRASQELEPGRGKLLNIALCEEKLGFVTAATQHFQQLMPLLPSDDERVALVQQHLADLAPRATHLRLDLSSAAPAGTTVTFDGLPLAAAKLGTEMALDPGQYVVRVNATSLPERRYEVLVAEGKTMALTVEPGVVAQPKPIAQSEAPGPASRRRQVGFIVGGVGIAGVAAGAVTGILALVDRGFIDEQCPARAGCSADVLARASAGKSLSVVSALSLSAGAVGIGAGIYLVLSKGTSPNAPAAGLTLLPGGGRVGIRGTF